jgi:hypothetical protein
MLMTLIAIASVAAAFLLIRQGVMLMPKSAGVFSTQQLNEAIQKAGGPEILAKESDELLLWSKGGFTSSFDLKNSPAISKLASLIGGEIVGIWPSGGGVPAHIKIRRGSHFDYQFIYIFGSGSVPDTSSESLVQIGGSVYLRNTGAK